MERQLGAADDWSARDSLLHMEYKKWHFWHYYDWKILERTILQRILFQVKQHGLAQGMMTLETMVLSRRRVKGKRGQKSSFSSPTNRMPVSVASSTMNWGDLLPNIYLNIRSMIYTVEEQGIDTAKGFY